MTTTLYCKQCQKSYDIRKTDVDLMFSIESKHLIRVEDGYRFQNGCFFKTLTKYRRTRSKR